MSVIIEVSELRKTYGSVVAVDNVSFTVEEGEIFGIVGPNGAGKTTTIECLEGLRRPDAGTVRVFGLDPWRQRRRLAADIGVQLQESALPDRLRVGEAISLFAALYPNSLDPYQLLAQLGLIDQVHTPFAALSGGQKQRLFLALALVHDPRLLFLDELTTGLDPHARRTVWDLIRFVRARGKTILLSTHLMEEAEELCDRIAVVHQGRIVALDTPSRLIARVVGGLRIALRIPDGTPLPPLGQLPGVRSVEILDQTLLVRADDDRVVAAVVQALVQHGIPLRELRVSSGRLEDAYLVLTGSALSRPEQ
ncbi:ABC transporter ATP-binding protein [Thermomicrobium sp. CFH 73360]|uniref:ABC transporter ATP-binding protein n=1 Tax=Thermomicrobium sp. CFH 73360 TaxID=2951987 RepID=UPI002076DF9F|nr:ABC transporter ATP-binding protein [Thermomicrobium sp. CFH 73360]MCM8746408.1 ABC transporter ATP-binding protein [Thermomicrobium sp. CFH 73360]